MKIFFYLISIFLCVACFSEPEKVETKSQANESSNTARTAGASILSINQFESDQDAIVTLLEYEQAEPYVYLNEFDAIAGNQDIQDRILREVQSLSENAELNSISPNQRMQAKQALLAKCYQEDECHYVPESYKLLSNTAGLLNLEYGYNQWMDRDEWFKYAVFDMSNGQRITYKVMFTDAKAVLSILEQRYLAVFQGYLEINKRQTEEDEEAYQLYLEHLENRVPFELDDLNSLELIFNNADELEFLYFHYQGQAGYYRDFFPNGYIEIPAKEILSNFSPNFSIRLNQ